MLEGLFLGRPVIVKQRFKKMYRHPSLDKRLTSSRLKGEVRSLIKARKLGVRTPTLFHVDTETSSIYMERIEGHSVKALLRGDSLEADKTSLLMEEIGRAVAKLHDGGLVHGDLTTSNMMVRNSDGALMLIDFGLSYNSTIPEDKAVDLYVLERAFASAHAEKGETLFEVFKESYRRSSRQWCSTLNKFADVRMRGRKRAMIG